MISKLEFASSPGPERKDRPGPTAEERVKVDVIINRHGAEAGPIISVLQDVQEEFNYLPAPVLRYVSQELDIPLAAILKVATFYSLFSLKPRGKHIINVCQGTTCFVRGGYRIQEELERTLAIKPGEVTSDGKFSLQVVRCLGSGAPAPVIQVDRKVYAHMRPGRVREILAEY